MYRFVSLLLVFLFALFTIQVKGRQVTKDRSFSGGITPPFTICARCRQLGNAQCINQFCLGGTTERASPSFTICALCQQLGDVQCINQFCLGGTTESRSPSFTICALCRQLGDAQCLNQFCLGGTTERTSPPFTICALCQQIGDAQCINQFCLGGTTAGASPLLTICALCRQLGDAKCIGQSCFAGKPIVRTPNAGIRLSKSIINRQNAQFVRRPILQRPISFARQTLSVSQRKYPSRYMRSNSNGNSKHRSYLLPTRKKSGILNNPVPY